MQGYETITHKTRITKERPARCFSTLKQKECHTGEPLAACKNSRNVTRQMDLH
jgi:hypothetical protein